MTCDARPQRDNRPLGAEGRLASFMLGLVVTKGNQMTNEMQSINVAELDQVTGGDGGPNQTGGSGNIGVTTPGKIQIGIQGEGHVNETDVGKAIGKMTPDQVADNVARGGGFHF
jgi:hypothetical protein